MSNNRAVLAPAKNNRPTSHRREHRPIINVMIKTIPSCLVVLLLVATLIVATSAETADGVTTAKKEIDDNTMAQVLANEIPLDILVGSSSTTAAAEHDELTTKRSEIIDDMPSSLYYNIPADYESKTAQEKFNILMDLIKQTEGTEGKYPNFVGLLTLLLFDDITPTVDHYSDFIPYNHEKRIHSVGPVASIKFESNGGNSGYTGIFESGSQYGFIRLSSATSANKKKLIPGAGIKFLRDGMPSANFVAMYSLDGQGNNGNFFENSFTNHFNKTNDIALKLVANKFEEISSPAEFVGLSDIASYTNDGSKIPDDDIVFPYEIILVPNKNLKDQFTNTPCTEDDLKTLLTSIPTDTKLYDVYTRSSPSSGYTNIGTITLTSELMYSKFGDDSLFFRHQKIEDDLELKPEWHDDVYNTAFADEFDRRSLLRRTSRKCPLGFDNDE